MLVSAAGALAIVGAVAAASRLLPGLMWRYRGADTGFHLFLRREIRRNRMRIPARLDPLLLDERLTYPWAFHWFSAWLPAAWLTRIPPLTSAVADAAQAVLVAWVAIVIAPAADPALDPAAAGLAAGLVFATAPALLVMGTGPRAFEVTPRPFGELAVAAMMIAFGFHLQSGSAVSVVVAALAGGLALLSSKFAAQALYFSVPPAALFAGTPRPLLLLPLALIAALLLSGGRYRWVLQGQILHLRIYRRRIQFEHSEVRDRNRWDSLAHAIIALVRHPHDPVARRALIRAAEQNAMLQFLLRNVLWCGTIAAIALSWPGGWHAQGSGWHRWLASWAVAPMVPFLATSLRRFRFLGEAERYPEYGIAAVSILAGIGLMRLPTPMALAVALLYALTLIPALTYTCARLWWNSRRVGATELDELSAFLRARPGPATLLSLPWHPVMQILPQLEHRHLIASDGAVWFRRYDEIFLKYPWPVPDLQMWRTAGAELVILDWPRAAREGVEYATASLRLLFENARYRVYEWPRAPERTAA